jgi:hypothetical protein
MFSLPGEGQPLLSIDRLDAEKAPVLPHLPTLDFYPPEVRTLGRKTRPNRGTSGARSGASRGFRGLQQDRAARA